jgi:peptidoglycan hydrolase-like protein with peptidoglycan-binding domain
MKSINSKRVAAGCAIAASAVLAGPANAMIPPDDGGGASSLPTVNMEAVLKAAQLDPGRPGTGITRGAKPSVLRVERALANQGLLARNLVDGSYGSSTIAAYAAWQQKLGFSGIGANGLPGKTSLTRLGKGRFTVTRVVDPGARVAYSGVTVNTRTRAMLRAAGRRVARGCVLDLTQGSYSSGVSQSAGTHDGGGAADISVHSLCGRSHAAVVRALRTVGFAAWYRTPAQGDWPTHIHAIAISDPDLSSGAQSQVGDYFSGRNGLAGHGPDDGPAVPKVTWEQFKRAR